MGLNNIIPEPNCTVEHGSYEYCSVETYLLFRAASQLAKELI